MPKTVKIPHATKEQILWWEMANFAAECGGCARGSEFESRIQISSQRQGIETGTRGLPLSIQAKTG